MNTKIKTFIMTIKFYITRSQSYLSIVNACMVLVVMLNQFNLSISRYVPILIFFGLIGLVTWGWMDNKFGLYHEEVLAINRKNPVQQKMFQRFDDLEKKIERIERELNGNL